MYPETISLEVDSPGDFVLAELIRPGSNNILVAANANSRYASVQAGYLYVQLLISRTLIPISSTYAQLLAGPTFGIYTTRPGPVIFRFLMTRS